MLKHLVKHYPHVKINEDVKEKKLLNKLKEEVDEVIRAHERGDLINLLEELEDVVQVALNYSREMCKRYGQSREVVNGRHLNKLRTRRLIPAEPKKKELA